MNILLATPLYAPDIGGPATHAAFAAAELPKCGCTVTVIPFSRVRHYPKVLRHMIYFFLVLRGGIRSDVVYALDPVSVGLPASIAALLLRKRFILRVAGDYAWEQGVGRFGVTDDLDAFLRNQQYSWPVRFFQQVQRFVAARAERIVVPSTYFKSVIVRWGVAPKKIAVVYSALEPILISTKDAVHTQLSQSPGLRIVSAGRLVKWKGFPALLEAFCVVLQTFPDAQLHIVGSGPELPAIKEKITTLKLEQHVVLTGQLSQEALWARIAAADVFVLNTHYEGLSHQLIEVMQIGTPVVTTPVGGNVELVVDEVSGLLCRPDDSEGLARSIVRICTDSALAVRLRDGARRALQQFSPDQSIAALASVFVGGDAPAGARVLMLSGDAHALVPESAVHARLLLQAREVAWLEVYVRGVEGQILLGSHGVVRGFSGSKLRVAWRMLRTGVRFQPNVITAQDPFFLGLIAWRIARKTNAALQLQVHTNLCAPEYAQTHHSAVVLARFLLPKARGVRVVSASIARAIPTLAPSAAVSVLPVYIDQDAVMRAPNSSLFAAYTTITKRILITARLEREKRVDECIRLLAPVLRELPGAGLFIAGDGSQKTKLQALAVALGIADRVVFLGFRYDVFSLYKSADLVIAATADYEGYGAATVEALLAGAPVLSRDVGVAREAGADLYTPEGFAAQAIAILTQGRRGTLVMPLLSPEQWVRQWHEGIAACMV